MLNKIKNLIRIDGLLHILVNLSVFLAFALFDPALIAGIIVTIFISVFKECYDISKYKQTNTEKAVIIKETTHDLICDLIGILTGLLICMLAGLSI